MAVDTLWNPGHSLNKTKSHYVAAACQMQMWLSLHTGCTQRGEDGIKTYQLPDTKSTNSCYERSSKKWNVWSVKTEPRDTFRSLGRSDQEVVLTYLVYNFSDCIGTTFCSTWNRHYGARSSYRIPSVTTSLYQKVSGLAAWSENYK